MSRMSLRLHCSVNVLNVVILFDTLDELLDVSLCIALENLEVNVRKAGELSCDKLITIVLDPLLDSVEGCELTIKNDFHFLVLVLLLEDLLHAVVDKLKLELLEIVWISRLHSEHALAVEHIVHAS